MFSDEELRQSSSYIDELRSGAKSLEAMEPYELTSQRHAALKHMSKTICFVPLQLEEDMAVTMFVTGEQSYSDFVSSLPKVVSDNPDIIFVVKPHPLSKGGELPRFQNLIVADRSENVHSLIDLSSFVVCYNSGVGLLAALHEKPTVTLGNAFYRLDGAVQHARSFEEAVSLYVAAGVKAAGRGVLEKLAAWFLFRRYSTFIATDDVVDFAYRKAHNYRDVLVTKLMLNGRRISMRREQEFSPFHWNSYAASSTGVVRPTPQPSARVLTRGEKLEEWARKDYALGDYEKAVGLFLRAYKERPLEANLLRCAAEACYHMGQRREAIDLMDRAGAQMPKNKQLKLRRLVMQYPYLRHVLGDRSFAVVK
ncbi:Capsule polysaccharide biosynthesis protein [compost metagenome]